MAPFELRHNAVSNAVELRIPYSGLESRARFQMAFAEAVARSLESQTPAQEESRDQVLDTLREHYLEKIESVQTRNGHVLQLPLRHLPRTFDNVKKSRALVDAIAFQLTKLGHVGESEIEVNHQPNKREK